MAFNGSLIRCGSTEFPLDLVFKESYTVAPNRRQDLDSTRNANGKLERNVLDHTPSTITIQTKQMDNKDMARLMGVITGAYSVPKERKLPITYYCPDTDSYKTGDFYVADIEFPINRVEVENKRIVYNSTQIDFVEY